MKRKDHDSLYRFAEDFDQPDRSIFSIYSFPLRLPFVNKICGFLWNRTLLFSLVIGVGLLCLVIIQMYLFFNLPIDITPYDIIQEKTYFDVSEVNSSQAIPSEISIEETVRETSYQHSVIFTDSESGLCKHKNFMGNSPSDANANNNFVSEIFFSTPETAKIEEDIQTSFDLKIPINTWKYVQICIAPHRHYHFIELVLETHNPSHNCDVYIGARFKPSINLWDFKSDSKGRDSIRIPTYLQEMKNSEGSIYVGVYGQEQREYKSGFFSGFQGKEDVCTLKITVANIENSELLHKMNLRGGQVLLPRDVQPILADIPSQ